MSSDKKPQQIQTEIHHSDSESNSHSKKEENKDEFESNHNYSDEELEAVNSVNSENHIDEIVFDPEGENVPISKENIEDYREKVRKSGVVYISYIPEGMTVKFLREKLENYGLTRIYLAPKNKELLGETKKKSNKKQIFKEGWGEFSNKLMAKLAEFELNGKPFGGKRNLLFREELWTVKYLHKFKWHHLIEKMNYNKKLREQRLNAEIAQAKRETNFIEKKFEQSSIFNKKRKRENEKSEIKEQIPSENIEENKQNAGDSRFYLEKFKRNFKQRQPLLK
jgi:ESF2/ABP1 family protein